MTKLAVFVKIQAQPGKREQVKQIWEKLVRPTVETEKTIDLFFHCFAHGEDDTICLFELISDPSSFKAAMQSDFFQDYLEKLKPLLVGPPEIITTTPVWAKGASI